MLLQLGIEKCENEFNCVILYLYMDMDMILMISCTRDLTEANVTHFCCSISSKEKVLLSTTSTEYLHQHSCYLGSGCDLRLLMISAFLAQQFPMFTSSLDYFRRASSLKRYLSFRTVSSKIICCCNTLKNGFRRKVET